MRVLLVLLSMLLLPLSLSAAEKLKVVTSFSILADITHQVGGDYIQVINLVGPDKDAHLYQPTSDDSRNLLKADLIISNGLGFEPWLDRLVANSGTKKPLIVASHGVIPRTLEQNGTTLTDPHAWQNLSDVELYVNNITGALIAADPANQKSYLSNSRAYIKVLHALRQEARTKLGTLPVGKLPPGARRFVTSHDAFGYMGKSYDIEFIAPQGISAEQEPTSAEIVSLVAQVRDIKAKAVFIDNITPPHRQQQIADESGTELGGTLYSDALAAKGPASTFAGLYETNINTLYDVLNKP